MRWLACLLPGSVLLALGVLAPGAFGQIAPPSAAGDRIAMRVEVFGFVGLNVLTLHSHIEEAGQRYAIVVDYATSGIAGMVVDIKTRSEAQGLLTPVSAIPQTFRSETRRSGSERRSHVDYRPDGVVEGGSVPPPRQAIPAAAMRGTVDNLTAYFRLERQLAATGSCALAVPVFDGRHRYDLHFTDAGRAVLSPEGGQNFRGPAIACRMVRRYAEGLPQPDTDEGARRGTLWYARLLPGDVMVPVRMELETQLGTVDGYLAELHGRGVNLKLME